MGGTEEADDEDEKGAAKDLKTVKVSEGSEEEARLLSLLAAEYKTFLLAKRKIALANLNDPEQKQFFEGLFRFGEDESETHLRIKIRGGLSVAPKLFGALKSGSAFSDDLDLSQSVD